MTDANYSSTMIAQQWVHPDLNRHVAEKESAPARSAVDTAAQEVDTIKDFASRLKHDLKDKRSVLVNCQKRLQEALEQVHALEEMTGLSWRVYSSQLSQLQFHKAQLSSKTVPAATAVSYTYSQLETLAQPLPLVDVGFLHLFRQSTTALRARAADIHAFVERFAPLFPVNEETGLVDVPVLMGEPCLVDATESVCPVMGCPYWHADQLEHLRRVLQRTLEAIAACAGSDPNLCPALYFCLSVQRTLRGCRTVDELCACMAEALNTVVAHGWHVNLLLPSGTAWAWTPSLTLPPRQPAAALLRNPVELEAWGAVEAAGGDGCRCFAERQDSVVWRILMRQGGSPGARRWLAERGLTLFPACPQLHVSLMSSLIECGAPAEDCFRTCLNGVRLLAGQVAAASALGVDERFCQTASRCIAYMSALCLAYVSGHDSKLGVHLLTTLLEDNGGQSALLPAAVTNFTLLLVVLRQTDSLSNMHALPLAAISDVPFTLSEPFPSPPKDFCRALLNGNNALVRRCQAELLYSDTFDQILAAVQSSLVTSFSFNLQFVEQLTKSVSSGSDVAQVTQWLTYVHSVRRFHRQWGAQQVLERLLLSSAGHCTLTLAAVWELEDMKLFVGVDAFCEEFAKANEIDVSRLDCVDYLLSFDPAITVIEWTSFLILRSRHQAATLEQRYEALKNIPIELYVNDFSASVLVLLERLKVACTLTDPHASIEETIETFLCLFRETHLQWWSPVDVWFNSAVGVPHYLSLFIFHLMPSLLSSPESIRRSRVCLVQTAAKLGVLHPLLRSG